MGLNGYVLEFNGSQSDFMGLMDIYIMEFDGTMMEMHGIYNWLEWDFVRENIIKIHGI